MTVGVSGVSGTAAESREVRARRGSTGPAAWSRQERRFPYLALAPAVVLITTVGLLPNVYTLALSLHDYELVNPPAKFVGLANYMDLVLNNPRLVHAVAFTVLFALAATTLELLLGFVIAYLLADREVSSGYSSAIRTLLMLPFIAPPVAMSYVFKTLIYDPTFGYLNYFLGLLNLPAFNMYDGAIRAPLAILAMEVILRTPFIVIVLYAGISSIEPTILDASRVDGASRFQEIIRIIVPIITPVAVIAYALRFIDALKMFDEIYVVTGGGPGFVTENINLYTTSEAFVYFRMGYAAASAFLFLLLVTILVSGFVRSFKL
jgi:multiple sugar transport system permease protein